MKVVFVGPSLNERAMSTFRPRIEFRPPAQFGDIARAVLEGATTIGLIDGLFEDRAAVWHKEILFALSEGVHVFGAASMGALRAAECEPFGMIGIGEVFRRFAAGELIDDDAVTQIHAPRELQYAALSEPLVNIDATASALLIAGLIAPGEARAICEAARDRFFKERTIAHAIDAARELDDRRRPDLHRLFAHYRRDVKADDAQALLFAVDETPNNRAGTPRDWLFRETQIWRRLLSELRSSINRQPTLQSTRAPDS